MIQGITAGQKHNYHKYLIAIILYTYLCSVQLSLYIQSSLTAPNKATK